MPTITIDTPALRPAKRRAIAVRLTRWLANQGVDPAHAIVRFVDTAADTIYSGAMPLDMLPQGNSPLHFAAVTCCVAPDRDEEFRAAMADEVAAALGLTEQSPFLYIEFRRTSPGDAYFARGGRLVRADESAAATTEGNADR